MPQERADIERRGERSTGGQECFGLLELDFGLPNQLDACERIRRLVELRAVERERRVIGLQFHELSVVGIEVALLAEQERQHADLTVAGEER